MFHDMDSDLIRAWQLLHELSEQNAHNHKMSAALQSQAGALKVRPSRLLVSTGQSYMRSDLE